MEEKPVVEEKVEEKPSEGYVYARDHGKSMAVLAHEIEQEAIKKAQEEEKKPEEGVSENAEVVEEKPKEEVVTAPEKPVETPAPPPPIDTAKIASEAAQKAVEEYKAEAQKIQDSALSEVDKAKQQEELKARWTGRSATGEVVPAGYDEIIEESKRINEAQTRKIIADREAERAAEAKVVADKAEADKANQEKAQEEYRQSVERMALAELEELRADGVMPKPVNPNDRNDPAVKEAEALFAKALEINTQRLAEKKDPIFSIARVFYNYYKKDIKPAQPAGADAPVSGSKTTPTEKSADENTYNYGRDHGKSFMQIMREIVTPAKK